MKTITLLFCFVVVLVSGCHILSSDKAPSPDITIEPSTIFEGQEIAISISSSREFIMPYCCGITYEIEKLKSEGWS